MAALAALIFLLICSTITESSKIGAQKPKRPKRAVHNSISKEPSNGCQNALSGAWVNQLGSRLQIHHDHDGHLSGTYKTAVEQVPGYAGANHSTVKGTVNGRLVTWTVVWGGSQSVAAWSGQWFCKCGQGARASCETLHTTWILTTAVSSCDHHWGQTRIGHDTFTRELLNADSATDLTNQQPETQTERT